MDAGLKVNIVSFVGSTAMRFASAPVERFRDAPPRHHPATVCKDAINQAVHPLALRCEEGLNNIERVINTAGHYYWIACNECVKVCPNNLDTGKAGKGGAS